MEMDFPFSHSFIRYSDMLLKVFLCEASFRDINNLNRFALKETQHSATMFQDAPDNSVPIYFPWRIYLHIFPYYEKAKWKIQSFPIRFQLVQSEQNINDSRQDT